MKTNEHIIKEFEKVNADLRKRLRELEAEKQSLKQMFQAQQELLSQRNAVIAEPESELSVKGGLLNIKNGLNTAEPNDRKKEFNEICDMFADYMEGYNKSGVIRFLVELTQKLRENGVMYTVESFDGEINVKDIEVGNPRKITVRIDGMPKGYTEEKICEIVRAYEDIKHCKEHAGEHLHSEEHLKIISLRQEIECLKRNSSKKDELIKSLKSKLDESAEGERSLCEEIEKLEAEKRESKDKMFPYESIEKMKEKMSELNDRHQSDCIEKTQLHTALDVMTEKYQRLREIHGL